MKLWGGRGGGGRTPLMFSNMLLLVEKKKTNISMGLLVRNQINLMTPFEPMREDWPRCV